MVYKYKSIFNFTYTYKKENKIALFTYQIGNNI